MSTDQAVGDRRELDRITLTVACLLSTLFSFPSLSLFLSLFLSLLLFFLSLSLSHIALASAASGSWPQSQRFMSQVVDHDVCL